MATSLLIVEESGHSETIAVESFGQGYWVVRSVPFISREISMGDIVTLTPTGRLDEIIARGGSRTLRINVEPAHITSAQGIAGALNAMGCSVEHGFDGFYAVSVPADAPYLGVSTYLETLRDDGVLDLSRGWCPE